MSMSDRDVRRKSSKYLREMSWQRKSLAIGNSRAPRGLIEDLPTTLDFEDGLSCAGNGNILDIATLVLNTDTWRRGKRPRP